MTLQWVGRQKQENGSPSGTTRSPRPHNRRTKSRLGLAEALQLARYLAACAEGAREESLDIPLLLALRDVETDSVTAKTLVDLRLALDLAERLDARTRSSGQIAPLLRIVLTALSGPALIVARKGRARPRRETQDAATADHLRLVR